MFHIKLKELREQQSLTQKQLSEILRISRSALASYETGVREPDFNMLMNIAQYFNVSVDYLLRHNSKQEDENIYDNKNSYQLIDDIDTLTEKSREELQRYIQLLKISEMYENETDDNLITNRKSNVE